MRLIKSEVPSGESAADAPLPKLRADLRFDQRARGGLFDVTDPNTARTFTLYDFEVALARLLDGRRVPDDMIQAGVRLGIPVDRDSLAKFLRQLKQYGFLEEPVSPKSKVTGDLEARPEWDVGVAELYQSGVRLLRLGRHGEAANYFSAILEVDPTIAEVKRLLELTRGPQGPPPANSNTDIPTLALQPEEIVVAEETPDIPIEEEAPEEHAPDEEGLPPRGRGRYVWGVLLVAGIGAGVAYRMGVFPSLSPTSPSPTAKVSLPPARITPPPPAEKTAARVPRRSWLSVNVQQKARPEVASIKAPSSGVLVWVLPEGSAVRRGTVVAVIRPFRGRLTPQRLAALEARARKDARSGRPAKLLVRAPIDGVLRRLSATSTQVRVNDALGGLASAEGWRLTARIPAPGSVPDSKCELSDAAGNVASCTLVSAAPVGDAFEVTAEVKGGETEWLDGSVDAQLSVEIDR